MNLNDKKGVSGVVTAVLLILLVIAAIGILWVVVQNFVSEGAEQISDATACQTTSLETQSVNSTTVIVKRLTGSTDIESVRVLVDGSLDVNHEVTAGGFGIGETESIIFSFELIAGTYEIEAGAVFDGTACQPSAPFEITIT